MNFPFWLFILFVVLVSTLLRPRFWEFIFAILRFDVPPERRKREQAKPSWRGPFRSGDFGNHGDE